MLGVDYLPIDNNGELDETLIKDIVENTIYRNLIEYGIKGFENQL